MEKIKPNKITALIAPLLLFVGFTFVGYLSPTMPLMTDALVSFFGAVFLYLFFTETIELKLVSASPQKIIQTRFWIFRKTIEIHTVTAVSLEPMYRGAGLAIPALGISYSGGHYTYHHQISVAHFGEEAIKRLVLFIQKFNPAVKIDKKIVSKFGLKLN